jgi:hypothetical protein
MIYYEVCHGPGGLRVKERLVEKETPAFLWFKGKGWRVAKKDLKPFGYGESPAEAILLYVHRRLVWAEEKEKEALFYRGQIAEAEKLEF